MSTATSDASLAGHPLAVRVNARARRLRLRVDPRGGGLVLTVPPGISRRRALEWAAGHGEWARSALQAVPERAPIGPGGTVMLRGRPHRIVWDPEQKRGVAAADGVLRVGGPVEHVESRVLQWLQREARGVLRGETGEYAAKLGRGEVRVGIGDPRSRWGSCSSRGTIRYSWRLIMAPDFVRRATVAHEVAHLVHMNHGPQFHALVRELLGADPKPAREWLRRNGAMLHRAG